MRVLICRTAAGAEKALLNSGGSNVGKVSLCISGRHDCYGLDHNNVNLNATDF